MTNYARFCWRTITKSFVYFVFGLGSLVLVTTVFPVLMLFVHPADRCGRAMRRVTSGTFKFMRALMWLLGLTSVKISKEDRKLLGSLKSTIVVANHPSLLDVTILISYLPHADCIVNAALFRRPVVRLVVRRLFVPNSMEFGELMASCAKSLQAGNSLVIFPEGSRTKPGVKPVIKKGSARISLGTGFPVLPVHIEAGDMRGLQKGDPFYRINRKGRYTYALSVGDPIFPSAYRALSEPIAAKKMTADIHAAIFPASAGEER